MAQVQANVSVRVHIVRGARGDRLSVYGATGTAGERLLGILWTNPDETDHLASLIDPSGTRTITETGTVQAG